MARRDGWRGCILPALLGVVVLLAPVVVAGHIHASHAATSASCLLCTTADHGASDLPVVAHVPWQVSGDRAPAPAAPSTMVVRPLGASPSRGPPARSIPSPH